MDVTLFGKKKFAAIIKLRILRRGDYPRLSGWAQWSNHTGSYEKESGESRTEEQLTGIGNVTREARA